MDATQEKQQQAGTFMINPTSIPGDGEAPGGHDWREYRAASPTRALKIDAPFAIEKAEGRAESFPEGGYIVLDDEGRPVGWGPDEFLELHAEGSGLDGFSTVELLNTAHARLMGMREAASGHEGRAAAEITLGLRHLEDVGFRVRRGVAYLSLDALPESEVAWTHEAMEAPA